MKSVRRPAPSTKTKMPRRHGADKDAEARREIGIQRTLSKAQLPQCKSSISLGGGAKGVYAGWEMPWFKSQEALGPHFDHAAIFAGRSRPTPADVLDLRFDHHVEPPKRPTLRADSRCDSKIPGLH